MLDSCQLLLAMRGSVCVAALTHLRGCNTTDIYPIQDWNHLQCVCVCLAQHRIMAYCQHKKEAWQRKDAFADRYDNSVANLTKQHWDFLQSMLKDIHPAYIRDICITPEKVRALVQQKTMEWRITNKRADLFDWEALKMHKKLWDCMRRDKYGVERELEFREWCTKIQRRANEAKAAAKSTQTPLNNVVNDFCKRIWCDLLTNVLTPDQREHDKFQIRRNSRTDEITFRKGQRSWVHSKLRERLGDAKVGYYIFHHGIPDILNMDIMSSLEESGVPSDETLLHLLDELLRWQSAMLSSLVDHKNHFQEQRARDKAETIKTYCMGKALATERDNRKRYPFSMTNSELNALSQYESGKARTKT